jgi:hypothetical protein
LGSNQQALVPRVIGLTEATHELKPTTRSRGLTNRDTMLASCTPEAAGVFTRLLDQAVA